MGYLHIQVQHADVIHDFYREHLNPYLNFHRPCGQPQITTDAKGKQIRTYRHYQTPWEVFQALPGAAGYLRPGQTLEALTFQSLQHSATQAAHRMQDAKSKLFGCFYPEAQRA